MAINCTVASIILKNSFNGTIDYEKSTEDEKESQVKMIYLSGPLFTSGPT
jgi:hypothetical protein